MAAVSPNTAGVEVAIYGSASPCWSSGNSAAQCQTACTSGLDSLRSGTKAAECYEHFEGAFQPGTWTFTGTGCLVETTYPIALEAPVNDAFTMSQTECELSGADFTCSEDGEIMLKGTFTSPTAGKFYFVTGDCPESVMLISLYVD